MIDAHLHLDRYGEQLPKALRQIRTKAIRTLAVSMDVASFEETRRIAGTDPLITPAFGVHPWEAHRYASNLEALEQPLAEANAFGEIGLDYHFVREESRFEGQRTVFDFFLSAAEQRGRLINVHTKGAEAAVLDALKRYTLPAVIVHWYSGPLDLVQQYVDLGAYLTVGVEVLRSKLIRTIAEAIPADRLLTETDGPGAWEWMTNEVGFPEQIEIVEEAVAEARGISREDLSVQAEQNYINVLKLGGIEERVD